nr:hypothetical protein P5625_02135 [Bacillus subtilis]
MIRISMQGQMHLPLKQDAFVLLSVSSMAKSVPNTYTDHFMNSNMLKIHLFQKKKKKKKTKISVFLK